MRHDLRAVIDAAIAGVGAGSLVAKAFAHHHLDVALGQGRVHVIAAGKAAAPMMAAFLARCARPVAAAVAVGTHASVSLPPHVEWHEANHPVPDARSLAAGRRALAIADAVGAGDTLVVLLSGGASSLLACPLEGVTLGDKQHTSATLMAAGADIRALNTVRKHLSAVKGGRLAARCAGQTLTLAISDVVGDDMSVIGSGPGVPDASTWSDAHTVLLRYGGTGRYPAPVVNACERGMRGELPDTPAPGDAAMARSRALLVGSARDALDGARREAERLGYAVVVRPEPVVGEARDAAAEWFQDARRLVLERGRPACFLSAGETTVRVTGTGRGGRNQEFALALASLLTTVGSPTVAASVGTDGIDGPTDAAGAIVDSSTLDRAAAAGLGPPQAYLDLNDSYAYFAPLGDLVRTGRTDTNVGDVQVMLVG